MGEIREWQPDSETKITGEQIVIPRISLELCCSHILAGLQRHGQFRDVRLALDELLNQTVGAVWPTLYTLMGRDNKAFQNTADRRAMAKEIGTVVKMYFESNAGLKDFTKSALFNEVDEWANSIIPHEYSKPASPTAPQLPGELEGARVFFERAVNAGYINVTATGAKWAKTKAMLGYFCMKAFDTSPRPLAVIERFFDVRKLSSSITQASYEAKRADVKQWRADMNSKIFFD